MKNNNIKRELTIEEMIELGYDTKRIHDLIDKKVALQQKSAKIKQATENRNKVIAAIKDYLYTLGVPASILTVIPLDEALRNFEEEMVPALKVINQVPEKKEERTPLDDNAFESALAALRSFADSL